MADQQFCLRWNNHQSTLISVFDTLLENGTLVDCTLAAEGEYLKAHKVVLSACSPYLETLLSQHYEKHPIVILKDVKFTELKSMMDYMYRGEVNISQDQLGTFLKAAESLQIKGLSDNNEGDARDVGSTPKAPPPPRKAAQPAPPARSEPQRPDLAPESPAHRTRDGSISPSSRKRRRIRRTSQGEDSNLGDSHLDGSNSCDLPVQAQSTPIVPNIPAAVTSSITTTPIKTPIVKPEQTELVNRIDTSNLNSLPPESGLLKEKIEPISEPLLEPKTEYLEEMNNEDSVEDLTLDDDDDMDGMDISNMSNMSNISRPGPSHGTDVSNQGFAPWHLGGNQSGGTDEVFMAAQEAVGAHRDSQGSSSRFTEPVFVSTNVLEQKTADLFFSELNDPLDSDEGEVRIEEGLCSAKETKTFKRLKSLSKSKQLSCKSRAVPVFQKDERLLESKQEVNDYISSLEGADEKPIILERKKTNGRNSKGRILRNRIKFNNHTSSINTYDKNKVVISKVLKKPLTNSSIKEKMMINRKKSTAKNASLRLSNSTSLGIKSNTVSNLYNTKEKFHTILIKNENDTNNGKDSLFQPSASSKDPPLQVKQEKTKNKRNRKNKHINTTANNVFRCEECGRSYAYFRGLKQHQKLECNKEPQFSCPFCSSRYRYRQSVRDHVRKLHEEAFPKWYTTHYKGLMRRKRDSN